MLSILAIAALAPPGAVELVAVGDVMLGRSVQRRYEQVGGDYPFASVQPLFRRADLAFGNLECPLTDRPFESPNRIRLRAPGAWGARLKHAGFDALSLVNNHALDCGPGGLKDTRLALQTAGIRPVEGEPVDFRVRGLRVRFLALADYPPSHLLDETGLRDRLAAARVGADVFVLSLHWGVEGSSDPSTRQRRLARLASAAGVHLLIGHGPHVLQPIQRVGKTVVAYSLGNFIFDSATPLERETGVLRVKLGRQGAFEARIVRYRIEDGAPRVLP